MQNKISAYVVSYNREDTIEACLKSLQFADEILLIDKGSTDRTLEIAQPLVDKIVKVPWSPVVEETREYAETICSYDWVIFLDDDECCSIDLINFIERELVSPQSLVYKFPQRHFICGIHSEDAYYWPEWQIRMYKKGAIKFSQNVHDGYKLTTDRIFEVSPTEGACLFHFSHANIYTWIEKLNRYTSQPKRKRMLDPASGNDLLKYSHRALDRWCEKRQLKAVDSYEVMVAILRSVYDIVDRLKTWEEENFYDGKKSFEIECQKLIFQYQNYFKFDKFTRREPTSEISFPVLAISEGAQQPILAGTLQNLRPSVTQDHFDKLKMFSTIDEVRKQEITLLNELLENEKAKYSDVCEVLGQERDGAIIAIKDLENQISSAILSNISLKNAYEGSFSWKLTTPFRIISNFIRLLIRNTKLFAKLIVQKSGRVIFNLIPLPVSMKIKPVYFLYNSRFAFLFEGHRNYESWKKSIDVVEDFIPNPTHILSISNDQAIAIIESLSFKVSENPVVSILIPCFGNIAITARCLKSIFDFSPECDYEVIVIEDASGETLMDSLESVPGLIYSKNAKNLGFTISCNEAVRLARGKFLHFLNNDTEVKSGWLDKLLKVYDLREDCGLVGSKLIYPSGYLQEAGGIVWGNKNVWNYGRMQNPGDHSFNYLKSVDYCSGASLLVRKDLFVELGKFDPIYAPAYCEDTDLAFKVRDHGLQVYYQPFSEVIHHEGVSHGTSLTEGLKAYQAINQIKFQEKWRNELLDQVKNEDDVFWARDRSYKKKTILFIEEHVPTYDRDAGSRTIYQLICFFISQGYHVVFYPINLHVDKVYAPKLMEMGIEVIYSKVGSKYFEEWLRKFGKYLDTVIISRPNTFHSSEQILRRYFNGPLIYYGHDIHHLRMSMESKRLNKLEFNKETAAMLLMEQFAWSKADLVLYPSPEEVAIVQNYISSENANSVVRKMPIFILEPRDKPLPPIGPKQIIFVGGFNHYPNISGISWFVKYVFPMILVNMPEVKLLIIGSNPPGDVRSFAGRSIDVLGGISEQALDSIYQLSRVSIAPLLVGAGVKGKVVEAMGKGIPVVTTSVGAQGFDLDKCGLHVSDEPVEFMNFILKLLADDVEWRKASDKQYEYVEKNYSKEAMKMAFNGFV